MLCRKSGVESVVGERGVACHAHLANYTLYNRFPTQHDTLPQHLVYKNELNREYVITLARNDEIH